VEEPLDRKAIVVRSVVGSVMVIVIQMRRALKTPRETREGNLN
jgi:hypothetical protein